MKFFIFDYLEVLVPSDINTFYYANHTFIQVKLKENEKWCIWPAHLLVFDIVLGPLLCL